MTERKLREAVQAIATGDMTREAMIELAKGALVRDPAPEPPDWARLGRQLRYAAEDIFEGGAPTVEVAYEYMLFHSEAFDWIRWPDDMPTDPPELLQSAYDRTASEARLIRQGY
ncbi:MAG TPA: hypothetical protein VK789_28300 [Bryobacteraceae bacterium]|jgi:hypothetical protein|nr:hypothetical protein [Bryobacteraceae bacterium]